MFEFIECVGWFMSLDVDVEGLWLNSSGDGGVKNLSISVGEEVSVKIVEFLVMELGVDCRGVVWGWVVLVDRVNY